MSRRAWSLGERIADGGASGVSGVERGFFSEDAVANMCVVFNRGHAVINYLMNLRYMWSCVAVL